MIQLTYSSLAPPKKSGNSLFEHTSVICAVVMLVKKTDASSAILNTEENRLNPV